MTSPPEPRRVEVKDSGQTVAAAEVTTPCEHAGGTVRTSLYPSSGHIPPGSRARLVDSVMDLPEVRASARLEATVPLGDAEALQRLRERARDTVTRPAGSTALVVPGSAALGAGGISPVAGGLRRSARPPGEPGRLQGLSCAGRATRCQGPVPTTWPIVRAAST